ncbi:hypothetical protein EV207_11225 [Scopulibacillus darangshiensis]|uniref:Purine nucleoside phosphorylase n=1 Tax=Scopulibacillus darangshiensis TaxID=442528 RepID=A0A4R2P2Y5_9BACL|nr:peptidoglycan editing factor PgeF [Scopulibacillus darangshiensis]TCP29103.1 hypothetical protein EV207_11225 [Scopulibacillus darangshiensis]
MTSERFSIKAERFLTTESIYLSNNSALVLGITTRDGGVSRVPYATLNMGYHVKDHHEAVLENRQRLGEDLKMPLENWVAGEQIHDTKITRVSENDRGKGARDYDSVIKGTDGLYTTQSNLLLTACFADCVPIFFYTKKQPAVGVLHAGWKGTVGSIASKMIRIWHEELGISPDDINVIIGPSIGPCCYEVDKRVLKQVQQLDNDVDLKGVYHSSDRTGRYMLDLQGLNKRILMNAGVPGQNIHITNYCTGCRTDMFFSHRKENGKTGRIMGFIGIVKGDVKS